MKLPTGWLLLPSGKGIATGGANAAGDTAGGAKQGFAAAIADIRGGAAQRCGQCKCTSSANVRYAPKAVI
jgi:hypothetical protein